MTGIVIRKSNQSRIFNMICNLNQLPKVSIVREDGINIFMVEHINEFVPNFRFEWCSYKEHYRVYIYVASTNHVKKNAGYTICTIGSGLAAMGFGVLYSFLHKHRANQNGAKGTIN